MVTLGKLEAIPWVAMANLQGKHLEIILTKYLQWCKIERGLAKQTVAGKKQTLGHFLKYLDGEKLTLKTSKDYMYHLSSDLGWSANGIRSDFNSKVKPFIHWLFETKYIKIDWSKKIKVPKAQPKQYPVVSFEELDKTIFAGTSFTEKDCKLAKERRLENREALLFEARTGLRIGAIIGLKKEDVNLNSIPATFNVYSKGKFHTGIVPPDLIEMMKRRCVGPGKVFNVYGGSLNHYIRRGCEKLGISNDFHFHTMRHSFATSLLNNGTDISMVSKILGHSSIGITADIYSHYSVQDKARVINSIPTVRKSLSTEERAKIVIEKLQKDFGIIKYTRKGEKLTINIKI